MGELWQEKPRILKPEEYNNVIEVGPNGVKTPEEITNPDIIEKYGKKIKVLISEGAIKNMVSSLAGRVLNYYEGQDIQSLDTVVLYDGGRVFADDFLREFDRKNSDIVVRDNPIKIGSYKGEESTGLPKVITDFRYPVKGRNLLFLDDIADTLISTDFLYFHCNNPYRKPESMKFVALIDKPTKKRYKDAHVNVTDNGFLSIHSTENGIDLMPGFHLPHNIYVVGYGMDGDLKQGKEKVENVFRNLPFVGYLLPE